MNATFIKEKNASYQISCLQQAQILLLVILLKSFLIIRISLIGNKKGVSKHDYMSLLKFNTYMPMMLWNDSELNLAILQENLGVIM